MTPNRDEKTSGAGSPRRRARTIALSAAAGLLLIAAGAALGWAGAKVFVPTPAVEDASYTLVTVEEGSVSGHVAVNTRAQWAEHPAARNLMAGTVTSVSASAGQEITAGTVMYAVDLQSVVVMKGKTPAFRTMQSGDRGADVAQLQTFLIESGYLDGEADGAWAWSTTAAVLEWQSAAKLPVDGVADIGEVLFVADLPARVAVDTSTISPGAVVAGGEGGLVRLDTAPTFTIPVSDTQAATLPDDARVELTAPDGEIWNARISSRTTLEDSQVDLVLAGEEDAPICGDGCAQIPTGEGLLLVSRVITVEQTDGLVVPSSAVLTLPDGQTVLVDAEGTQHPVTVLSGARGLTAIDGVEPGLQVRAPAEIP
ncbi:peptidoglycan-binding domain-containing protein [uncultured Microbacterium sp.]|uniref:peptidoglycan-binding domain-containing protein n=1 Tax=uncultured Microbacterium sp. TaxID=191216 RepID=UPI0026353559|nr:peptidoglycan-binding domain-containing protein [uncultured Microbacterium sp.]